MPLTIRDAEIAILSAKVQLKEFQREFLGQWYGPIVDTMISIKWAQMTPGQHLALRQANPQAYDEIEAKVIKLQEGRK